MGLLINLGLAGDQHGADRGLLPGQRGGRLAGCADGSLAGILACEAVAVLMMGVLMVLSIKFGIDKARYIIMACVWVPVLGVLCWKSLPWFEAALHAAGNWLNALHVSQIVTLLAGAFVVSLAVYALCYLISVKVYQKTEL